VRVVDGACNAVICKMCLLSYSVKYQVINQKSNERPVIPSRPYIMVERVQSLSDGPPKNHMNAFLPTSAALVRAINCSPSPGRGMADGLKAQPF
jgi:hypothetical protein